MDPQASDQYRPDILAATRGGDHSVGMEGEADPATASLDQAVFWSSTYREILTMEEAVLAHLLELKEHQSVRSQREIELTNVPVIVSQVERFRARLGFWDSCVKSHH